jgi:chromosome segregation ATPase
MFPFFKNFVQAGGAQATEAMTNALVKASPETATRAQLQTMEDDLDNAGRLITKLQDELAEERKTYDRINSQYTQMMRAAEGLQTKIEAEKDPETKGSLTTSLNNLLAKIEQIVPELDQDKKDIDATQALLADAETAYKEKATELTNAKANLDRAKHDMQHATIEEQRAAQRAETARSVAGLRSQTGTGLNVALDSMNKSAEEARQRARSNDMKAHALTGAKKAEEDPNIKAAMDEAAGKEANHSVADRLAALKRRQ